MRSRVESDRRNLWKREEKRLERVIGKLKSLLDNVSFKIQRNIILYLYSSGFWLIEIIIKKRKMIIMFYLSLFFIS